MADNEKILEELKEELFAKFPLFIPYELIDNKPALTELLAYFSLTITQEFVDEYVDQLLYLDRDSKLHILSSVSEITNYSSSKRQLLQNNCTRLAELKDSLGKTTFNNIFIKYTTVLTTLTGFSAIMIYLFEKYPLEHLKDAPMFLFEQQTVILQRHVNDINKIIIDEGTHIDVQSFILNLANDLNLFAILDFEKFTENNITNSNQKDPVQKNGKIAEPFRNFIVHNKNEQIEKLVKDNLSHLRGVSLRYLIEYFINQKILTLKNKSAILRSIQMLFETQDIAHYNSIFGSDVFKKVDTDYTDAVVVFNHLFKEVLPPLLPNRPK